MPAHHKPKQPKKTNYGKLIKRTLLVWFALYAYSMTPHRWTSAKRVVLETVFRMGMPLIMLNSLASVDGTLPSLDPTELLPFEPRTPVVYVDNAEVGIPTLLAAEANRDTIVIWKNFTQGKLTQYQDEKFIRENFNNDSYFFLTNKSNYHQVEMGLHDALDRMDELYLGFSYTLLNRNPRLWQDVNTMLQEHGPQIQNIVPVNFSLHHAFMYKGKAYHTGMHQAPVGDWFIQLSNAKTWRFIEPKYTPYMGPFSTDGVSMLSKYDYLPDDTRIPYTDVTVEAGDLMFFPRHWWHEVHNEMDNIGIAFGFRPQMDVLRTPLDLLFPFLLPPGDAAHRYLVGAAALKKMANQIMAKLSSTDEDLTTLNKNSGVSSRGPMCKATKRLNEFVPGWSWNSRTGSTLTCESEGEGLNLVTKVSAKDL